MKQDQTETVYELALHDFGNLAYQLLDTKMERTELDQLADRMNFLFSKAGHSEQFKAIVHRIERNKEYHNET